MWVGSNFYTLPVPPPNGKLRTCIRFSDVINFLLLPQIFYCHFSVAVCECSENISVVVLCSYLLCENKKPPSQEHTVYGSTDINRRGESLFDFIFKSKLTLYYYMFQQLLDIFLRNVADRTALRRKFSDVFRPRWVTFKKCMK